MFYRVSFILSIIEYKATKSQAKNREKPTAWQIFIELIRIVSHIFIVIRVNIVKIIVAEIFAKNFQ